MAWYNTLFGLFGANATKQDIGGQFPYPNTMSTTVNVDEDTALKLSTVYRCVAITNNIIGSTPIQIIKREESIKDDLWDLLNLKPNPTQSAQQFRETMGLNFMLHGNAYARIVRNVLGNPVALWPIATQRISPELTSDGRMVYRYYELGTQASEVILEADDVLHLKNFGNGLTGISTIAYGAESISMAKSAEDYSKSFYTGGGKPSGVVETDQILQEQHRDIFRKNISADSAKQGIMLLEAGFKWKSMQLSPADLETLQNRKFGIEDVARWFGVPLSLLNIGEASNDRANGVEEAIRGWLMTDLQPLLHRFESEFRNKLLGVTERRETEVLFDSHRILQYDIGTLTDIGEKGVRNGIMTQNEARKLINLPPKQGGEYDELRQQQQMVSANEEVEESNNDELPTE